METSNLELITNDQSIHVEKENGTDVKYFIFEEAEIHLNRIKPHTIQEWHHHTKIDENLLIVDGKLLCKYIDENGNEKQLYGNSGDIIRVHQSVHTFENDTDQDVRFIVFRYIPEGEDKRQIIKNDKILDEIMRS